MVPTPCNASAMGPVANFSSARQNDATSGLTNATVVEYSDCEGANGTGLRQREEATEAAEHCC